MTENERLIDADGPNNKVLPGDWWAQNVLLDSAAAINLAMEPDILKQGRKWGYT
jgi:hypothetical protein